MEPRGKWMVFVRAWHSGHNSSTNINLNWEVKQGRIAISTIAGVTSNGLTRSEEGGRCLTSKNTRGNGYPRGGEGKFEVEKEKEAKIRMISWH